MVSFEEQTKTDKDSPIKQRASLVQLQQTMTAPTTHTPHGIEIPVADAEVPRESETLHTKKAHSTCKNKEKLELLERVQKKQQVLKCHVVHKAKCRRASQSVVHQVKREHIVLGPPKSHLILQAKVMTIDAPQPTNAPGVWCQRGLRVAQPPVGAV